MNLRPNDHQHVPNFCAALEAVADGSDPAAVFRRAAIYRVCREYLTANNLPTIPIGTFRRLMVATGYACGEDPAGNEIVTGLRLKKRQAR